jgi:hypothetical protein
VNAIDHLVPLYARLRRINGRYRYALVHEPNPPDEDA